MRLKYNFYILFICVLFFRDGVYGYTMSSFTIKQPNDFQKVT